MARRTARPNSPPLLLLLLLLAVLSGTASGTIMKLSFFQKLTPLVSVSCIQAYDAPVLTCRPREVTQKTCTLECQRSLTGVQARIQASCSRVRVQSDTLLFKAQRGILVDVLCGTAIDDTVTTTVTRTLPASSGFPPAPTANNTTTTTTRSTPAATSNSTSVQPPPRTTEMSINTSNNTNITTTTPTNTDTNATTTTTSSSSSSSSSSDESTLTSVTTTSTSQATTSEVPSLSTIPSTEAPTTSKEPPRQTLLPGSGGGSPFDFVGAGTSLKPTGQHMMSSVVGTCLMGLLLAYQ